MRSIDRRFEKASRQLPNGSTLTVFAAAISEQGFCRQRLHRAFNRLVDRDDYDGSTKRQVLAYMEKLNGHCGGQKTEINAPAEKRFVFQPMQEPQIQKVPVLS